MPIRLTPAQRAELETLMLDTAPRVPSTPPEEEGESAAMTTLRTISEMRNQRNIAYRRRLKDIAARYLAEKAARLELLTRVNRSRDELTLVQGQRDRARQERDAALARTQPAPSAPLSEQMEQLRQTALVWRDADNGTSAKLSAFRNFCAVLDSLPGPQQAPAPPADPMPF